jgi:predicted nucleic acid-binding protein
MTQRVFFDTNVFLYLLDRQTPRKQAQAETLLRVTAANGTGVTSYQVAQEFLNVATTKLRKQMTPAEALTYLLKLVWPMCEVSPTPTLYANALSIHQRTGWTFYDALIVAAAQAAECTVLYTEDLQDGRIIDGLQIKNPFL